MAEKAITTKQSNRPTNNQPTHERTNERTNDRSLRGSSPPSPPPPPTHDFDIIATKRGVGLDTNHQTQPTTRVDHVHRRPSTASDSDHRNQKSGRKSEGNRWWMMDTDCPSGLPNTVYGFTVLPFYEPEQETRNKKQATRRK